MIRTINPGSSSTKIKEYGNGKLDAVGLRVVHGGKFWRPTIIDDEVILEIKRFSSVAPTHNGAVLELIEAHRQENPGIPLIGVFDTEFFHDLPYKTKFYPIPFPLQKKYGIRRYGFHGISHESAVIQTAAVLKKPVSESNLITVHLGSGCSMAVIEKGRPIDTSMGFSPLEGLMMETRAGDIDVGILFYLLESGENINDLKEIFHEKAGIRGVSGRKGLKEMLNDLGEEDCRLALDMFVYRIQKYLGAYVFALKGIVDAVVFTGEIGENNERIRSKICEAFPVHLPVKFLHFPAKENELIRDKCQTLIQSH